MKAWAIEISPGNFLTHDGHTTDNLVNSCFWNFNEKEEAEDRLMKDECLILVDIKRTPGSAHLGELIAQIEIDVKHHSLTIEDATKMWKEGLEKVLTRRWLRKTISELPKE